MKKSILTAAALACAASALGANPILPLWEHIPDGEPYVFDDPDRPGKQRVYLYGSHDMLKTMYCGTDLVVWSADPDSLGSWRYDGVIFQAFSDGKPDVLFAPDVAEVTRPDGKKEYYLYPNNQVGGRNGMVARADRPDGPFEVINWSAEHPGQTDGVLRFDPAVFVDDDGRVYGYWGFERSMAAELDPSTMATVKPGCEVVEDLISGKNQEGVFRFFEASSIRKIDGMYVLIYSRWTDEGEYGLPGSNYTLAYAYSHNPLGPFTYGGTIIDGRGRDTDADGRAIVTATATGNTHGSIAQINGQWWVFYHRQNGTDEYARQAMVAPIDVKVENGKVYISEGEYTSEGFEIQGLNPLKRYPAAIASHYTGPTPCWQEYPRMHYSGPYFEAVYIDDHAVADPYAENINVAPVVNCTDGSTLGYKYYNFDRLTDPANLRLTLIPQGIDGTITAYASAPWKGNPQPLGHAEITASMPQQQTEIAIPLTGAETLQGKHPLYLTFSSKTKEKSLCTILYLQFSPAMQ